MKLRASSSPAAVALVGAVVASSWVSTACGPSTPAPAAPAPEPPPSAAPAPPASAAVDPLGPKPEPPAPPPFLPPTPDVFTATGGMTVWLLERHQVPIVSCDLTIPAGASSDPKGKGGLAYATATMLDEGAGKRGAIALSSAIDDLGARISTDTNADASFVSLTVLKRNLESSFALFSDVVARPRFEPAEFARVKDLWQNELKSREKDPDATARVVYRAVLFGAEHPYGHPWDGTAASAKTIAIEDVKSFYAKQWRPDRATLVCAGDVTKPELAHLLDESFSSWKAPSTPVPAGVVPEAPKGPWPKVVLVDRKDAPQAVIAVLRPGVSAADPAVPGLWRVNDAIGGSFSSRLNQDLREARGYTYGARSRYSMSRGPGQIVSWANVVTDKTSPALDALLDDLHKFADGGVTEDEVARTRSQARGEIVNVYESVEAIAGHLAGDASLGLPPDWEATTSQKRDAAQRADLDALAKQYYDPTNATIVVVGPLGVLQASLDKLGVSAPEMRDSEGNVIAAKAAKPAGKPLGPPAAPPAPKPATK
jgi:zinc protease